MVAYLGGQFYQMCFALGGCGVEKGDGDDKKVKELFDWKSSLYIYVIRGVYGNSKRFTEKKVAKIENNLLNKISCEKNFFGEIYFKTKFIIDIML